MTHFLALIGITLLCALWMAFQLWLKRVDPQRDDFKPGCGACQSRSCESAQGTSEKKITIEKSNRRKERA
ncbi:MAG: hypothetical protein OQK94_01145 [Gammaproteobacteria bacterium]|nr:hypothetical protein [Gammaproteobacteria bacterium]MCW8840959.1 hypothetical protein [Gammaproteobacteria bacterium]MCW8928437.1 hypothetical protein [Gammaproteobacteria bacterium]MCW8959002.1 hypothetical protein [Gammaproteobacteria bacterium]MCW8973414.1 hypothetical protein [Gammaproteobacteria bacterium]